jgi:ankyrin repeat protein
VKGDEQTGHYRDAMYTLHQYAELHDLDRDYEKNLRKQLKLEFKRREVSDEQVLGQFPSTVRRRVLRKLYLHALLRTSLMKGVRQQFVDAFLAACHVEVLTPGEEIVQRGTVSSDLFLLVDGVVEVDDKIETAVVKENEGLAGGTSIAGSELQRASGWSVCMVGGGEFINDVGFFTESPQAETMKTVVVSKILRLSRSAYKTLLEDHPGSFTRILENLLKKVEEAAAELGEAPEVNLTCRIDVLRAGSVFEDTSTSSSYNRDVQKTVAAVQSQTALTAVQDLIKMHMNKQKDDHTTRFLGAASRGEISTIVLMCEHGFDPNSADYDNRTALMVASMKGNNETVAKLLEYSCNPNLVDVHGTSALLEAVKNGNEETVALLLQNDARLCLAESKAASMLCQAVFDGDIMLLRRLLWAGIHANASDYDKRAAVHIAAAEGNVSALKVLVEAGADLGVKDRWGNTVSTEAKNANAGHVLEYLKTLSLQP